MSKIEDIYESDNVVVWKDEDTTFLSVWNITIAFPNEDWEDIKKELKEL